MIRYLKALSILLPLAVFVMPLTAFASFTGFSMLDDFNNYNNAGWVNINSHGGLTSVSTPCVEGNCVQFTTASGPAGIAVHQLTLPDSTSGSLFIYFRSDPGPFGAGTLNLNVGTTSNLSIGISYTPTDTVYHTLFVAWQDTSGHAEKQACGMIDDTDVSHCSWSDLSNYGHAENVNVVQTYIGGLINVTTNMDDLEGSFYNNTVTRIDSTIPAGGSVTGTSSPYSVGVSGYVSPNDFVAGATKITLKYSNGGFESSQLVGPLAALQQQPDNTASFTWDLATPGIFSVSTSTSIQVIGDYSLSSQITVPKFSILGFNFFTTTLAATSTNFIIATSTAFGTLRAAVQKDYANFVTTASSTINASVCSPISGNFSIGPCMSILFGFPTFGQLQGDFQALNSQVLTHQPWAYPTRFFGIITNSSSTVALPSFTVNIVIASGTETALTYNPGDMLTGGANLLNGITDPHSGKNMKDILMPFIQLFVAISVLIIIIFDLMAMGNHTKDGGGKQYT